MKIDLSICDLYELKHLLIEKIRLYEGIVSNDSTTLNDKEHFTERVKVMKDLKSKIVSYLES